MSALDYGLLEAAFLQVKERWPHLRPAAGLILGSGWGAVAEAFELSDSIPYRDLRGLGAATVLGHAGQLSKASVNGVDLLVFQGRRHFYEGAGWTPVALPIYLLKRFGAGVVVSTSASGAVRADLAPGQLMLITDHINLMGASPLIGEPRDIWSERFPDMSEVYDQKLRLRMLEAAREVKEDLQCGVYCACSGPAYETPAEVRLLRVLGADAVGMSTVPCAVLAKAAGLSVAGLSCLTNFAAGHPSGAIRHADAMSIVRLAAPRMRALVGRFFERLADEEWAVPGRRS